MLTVVFQVQHRDKTMESGTEPPPAKRICTEVTAVGKTAQTVANDVPTKENAVCESASKAQDTKDTKKGGNETVSKELPPTDTPVVTHPPGESQTKSVVSEAKTPAEKKNPQSTSGTKLNGYEASDRSFMAIDHVDLSRVIEGIQDCDFEIEEMTISANQKVMEIEKSLRESKKPVYCKRSELIQHIPEFWLTTLINHHHISHYINEADEDCLQYLKKLHVEEFDDSVSGFKISFLFEANPYFENEMICKEISFGPSGVLRSNATPIRWRPGHDLTRVTEASASSSKSQPQSFFHWFLQNSNPVQDKIAVFLRDDIWPNPLKYFQVHTEDSTIDVSSDGIMVDSSGEEEDEDESILVLEEGRCEDFDEDEDLELLENEGELLDEDFEDESEDDLLFDEEYDEFDDEDDDGIELIESRGIPKQRTVSTKKASPAVSSSVRSQPLDKNQAAPGNKTKEAAKVREQASHPGKAAKVREQPSPLGEAAKVTEQPSHPGEAAKVREQPPRLGEAAKVTEQPSHPGEAAKVTEQPSQPGEGAAGKKDDPAQVSAQAVSADKTVISSSSTNTRTEETNPSSSEKESNEEQPTTVSSQKTESTAAVVDKEKAANADQIETTGNATDTKPDQKETPPTSSAS